MEKPYQRRQDVGLVVHDEQGRQMALDRLVQGQPLVAHQELLERFGGQWRAEQVTLDRIAPAASQKAGLRCSFNTFRQHREVEAARHHDGGGRNGCIHWILDDVTHKALIDLDLVKRKA